MIKAKRVKQRIEENFLDEYYCTLHSTGYIKVSKNSNGISDPTGTRAVELADISRDRHKQYNYYIKAKKALDELFQQVNDDEITLLKAHLEITKDSFTAARKKIGVSNLKAKRIVKRLKLKVYGKFKLL